MTEVEVRPATNADLPGIQAVLAAHDESATWPDLPGWPYLEHLLGRSGARMVVAVGDGSVIGMGSSVAVGSQDVRFLTDLFIHPERQDKGVGRALMEAALDGTTGRITFSSADPRALGMYIRAGMRPWWPLLYLSVPREAVLGDDAHTAESADAATTGSLSLAWTGMDRVEDFAHYARLPEGTGHVVRDARGEPVAVAWAHRRRSVPGRVLAHATLAPGADPVGVGLAALRAAVAETPSLIASIPGPHPVVPAILERGARIEDRDTYCATDPGILDPERIFPSPGYL